MLVTIDWTTMFLYFHCYSHDVLMVALCLHVPIVWAQNRYRLCPIYRSYSHRIPYLYPLVRLHRIQIGHHHHHHRRNHRITILITAVIIFAIEYEQEEN